MGRFKNNRKYQSIKPKKIIFIFCEGEKTEPLYFEGFKKDLEAKIRRKDVSVLIDGTGCNTLSLVKRANEKLSESPEGYDSKVDEKWLVFDEDTCKGGKFDNAIDKAESDGWKVAYSNECFELWYLLHFSYYNTDTGRDTYYEKLIPKLKDLDPTLQISNWRKDGKKLDEIYNLLKDKQPVAIKNAKKLMASYSGKQKNSPSNQRPSTTVYLLVEALNKLS